MTPKPTEYVVTLRAIADATDPEGVVLAGEFDE